MPTGYVTKNFVKLEASYEKGYTTASLQGSARSSKTFSIVQWLINRCISVPGTTVSIVRATLPAIKRSVFRDFIDILNTWGVYNPRNLNKSELVYYFDNGSWVEFFSCENEQKLRGPKRQILYVNEANEISYIEWQQLQMRTTMFSIIDYNPSFSEEHWINQVNQERKTCFWISTYKDNPFLEQRIIDEIESLQWKNPSLWQVYGLGQRAMVEGLVFPKFEIVNFMPTETMRCRFGGQDFGYSSDPSAGVEVRIYGKDLYINELFYRTEMLTNDLIKEWKKLDWSPKIISESADPRLIDEMYNAGLDIWPVHKYAGSIQAGIMKMQEYNIKITKQSLNVIKEFRNYTYRQDKEGKWLNEPIDSFNHCFSADTMVTTQRGQVHIDEVLSTDFALTSDGYYPIRRLFIQGCREVWLVRFTFANFAIEVEATPDHKIKTKKGWKQLRDLKPTDVLYLSTLSLTARSMVLQNKARIEQQKSLQHNSQETFGNSIMAIFRKVCCAVSKIATHSIRTKKISSAYQAMSCGILSVLKKKAKALKTKNSTVGFTTDTKVSDISAEEQNACTVSCGSSTTAKYQKGMLSTTRTRIPPITTSAILSSWRDTSICRSMRKNMLLTKERSLRCGIIWKKLLRRLRSGIAPKKGANGTVNTQNNRQQIGNIENTSVSVVEKNTIQEICRQTTPVSVPADVNPNGAETITLTTKRGSANGAEKSLRSTNTQKRNFAHEAVLESIDVLKVSKKPTFDIEVDGEHEFFANGILVHNCIDATRYVILEEVLGANASGMSSAQILGFDDD